MQQNWNMEMYEEEEDTLKGKYLIFTVGNELYGLEIRYIAEIVGLQPVTDIPEMPEYVKGITNLRGKIIPVIDARRRFHKPTREYDDRTCIIVIEATESPIGLIVDSVAEVQSIRLDDIAPPPEINNEKHKFIIGIGKTGGNVTLLLDCKRLLMDDETDSVGAMN